MNSSVSALDRLPVGHYVFPFALADVKGEIIVNMQFTLLDPHDVECGLSSQWVSTIVYSLALR
jgi:hypothetical protein